MAGINTRNALIKAQKGFEKDYADLMRDTLRRINQVLAEYTGEDGKIPPIKRDDAAQRGGEILQAVFVVRGRKSFREDMPVPISPFSTILMSWVGWSTLQVVRKHGAYMKRHIPDGLAAQMTRRGRVLSELTRTQILNIRASVLRLFEPNAYATYEPAHTWVDPNGYRLSDRIWRTSQDMRTRLDALISQRIREGASSLQISREMEQFLLPNAGLRTRRPYGTNASFNAMRLARTEISRAYGQASMIAARLNPFVEKMEWQLANTHPEFDICDENADRSPYDLNNIPQYPAHPHCLCALVPVVSQTPAEVTAMLRDEFETATRDINITPLDAEAMTSTLTGQFIFELAKRLEYIAAASL